MRLTVITVCNDFERYQRSRCLAVHRAKRRELYERN